MKGMRAALHLSATSTQSPHVGASGFYTIVDQLPASSTWAKFNVVLAAGPTGEEDQICRLII
jgi:hypothetical protein